MESFEKFATVSGDDIIDTVRLTERILPAEWTPAITSDGRLHSEREYRWHVRGDGYTEHNLINHVNIPHPDGKVTNHIVCHTLHADYGEDAIIRKDYMLDVETGRFTVGRDFVRRDQFRTYMTTVRQSINEPDGMRVELLAYEAGLMLPDDADWPDFQKLLAEAAMQHEVKQQRGGRLARLLGRLRGRS